MYLQVSRFNKKGLEQKEKKGRWLLFY